MAMALMGLGGIVAAVGGIWLLVIAFKEHIGWGLGCLFVPGVSLVFAIMKWNIAKTAFLIALAGSLVMGAGSYMAASQAAEALGNVTMADFEKAAKEVEAEAAAANAAAKAGADAVEAGGEEAPAE